MRIKWAGFPLTSLPVPMKPLPPPADPCWMSRSLESSGLCIFSPSVFSLLGAGGGVLLLPQPQSTSLGRWLSDPCGGPIFFSELKNLSILLATFIWILHLNFKLNFHHFPPGPIPLPSSHFSEVFWWTLSPKPVVGVTLDSCLSSSWPTNSISSSELGSAHLASSLPTTQIQATSPLTWLPAQPDVFSASSLAPPNLHAGPGHLTKMKIWSDHSNTYSPPKTDSLTKYKDSSFSENFSCLQTFLF